jgi:hypothetical protein
MKNKSLSNVADSILDSFLDSLDHSLSRLTESGLEGTSSWPDQKCSVASWICGDLLREAGFGEWRLINAQNDRGGRHDWLERDGIYYDPTAHQFSGVAGPLRGAAPNPLSLKYRNHRREYPATAAGRPSIEAMCDYLRPLLAAELEQQVSLQG